MRGTIHPLLLETIRPSSHRAPTHLSTVDFSPLLESAHPANLINIIADYVAPRVTIRAPRKERYRRYEDTGIVCPVLSLSALLWTDYTSTDARAIVDLPFAENFYKKRKRENHHADFVKRQKGLLLFGTRSSQSKQRLTADAKFVNVHFNNVSSLEYNFFTDTVISIARWFVLF